jgi:hypothetical protein
VSRSRKRAPLLLAGREQLRYRFREIVTAARIIELDRHTHLVPHVVDIVLDRLGRHLDPLRKFGAVRVPADLDRVEDLLKPIERRS